MAHNLPTQLPNETEAVPAAGHAVYTPSAPFVLTTIPALTFIDRFTAAEQAALMAANPVWAVEIAAAGTVTVTDKTLIADMTAAVTAGALTQARMSQVLNLAEASP